MRKIVLPIFMWGWGMIFLPQLALAAGFVSTVKRYPDEGIVIACAFTLLVGTIIAVKYQPPNDGISNMSPAFKGLIAFIGGSVAFIYMIAINKNLYLMQSLGVFAVSLTSPALLNILYTLAVEKLSSLITSIFPSNRKDKTED